MSMWSFTMLGWAGALMLSTRRSASLAISRAAVRIASFSPASTVTAPWSVNLDAQESRMASGAPYASATTLPDIVGKLSARAEIADASSPEQFTCPYHKCKWSRCKDN
jgi:hypothetical protein